MFNPSREQVRAFFIDSWRKHLNKQVLTPLETMAVDWTQQHPEYHDALAQKVGPHEAVHEIMECLGEVVWEAQRLGKPFDSNTYLDLIQRRTTRN